MAVVPSAIRGRSGATAAAAAHLPADSQGSAQGSPGPASCCPSPAGGGGQAGSSDLSEGSPSPRQSCQAAVR
eukprot:11646054-Alexandrium_andersonii.AAC.1